MEMVGTGFSEQVFELYQIIMFQKIVQAERQMVMSHIGKIVSAPPLDEKADTQVK